MTRFIQRFYCAILFAVLPLTPVVAQSAEAAGSISGASAFIKTLGDQALSVIVGNGQNKEQKRTNLENVFSQTVDIEWVGRFVMGRYWRQASDIQKASYLKAYRAFVLSHYAENFVDHNNGSFKLGETRADQNGNYIVPMVISAPKISDVNLQYRVRPQASGSYKIIDVVVEGISLITTQRSEFASVLDEHGIDYLTDQLSHRAIAAK